MLARGRRYGQAVGVGWERLEAPVAASAAEAQVVRCRSLSGRSPSCQPRPCSVRPLSVVVGAPASPVRGVSRGAVHRAAARNRPSPSDGRRCGAAGGSATPGRTADTQGLHGPREALQLSLGRTTRARAAERFALSDNRRYFIGNVANKSIYLLITQSNINWRINIGESGAGCYDQR